MRALMIALCLGAGFAALRTAPGYAADKQVTAQQQRMKDCNAEAGSKKLWGDARKTSMSTWLKGS